MSTSKKKTVKQPATAPAAVDSLTILYPDTAGIDIDCESVWVSVPQDRDAKPLRHFRLFTADLIELAHWLSACGIRNVVMEATGVYWIGPYDILEEHGFEVCLVNPAHAKNLPGRKSDESDCQWLRRLYTFGLLKSSFRPDSDIRVVRAYMRHRASLIEHRAAHIQHMQKALRQMNLLLSPIITDITGVTGMAIIRAILAGERDPVTLAQLRDRKCAQPESAFVKALQGNYREEYLFALKQALALYEAYSEQIRECDREIERAAGKIEPVHTDELLPLDPSVKSKSHSKNALTYDVRTQLYEMLGVDLVAVDGLNESTALTIISEIGVDIERWPNEKQFCAWLGLAPRQDKSGGKVLRSRILKTHNRAGQAFRMAAQSVSKSQTAFGAFFRKMRAKQGPRVAIVATAHKIARTVYAMLKYHRPYQQKSSDEYLDRERERELARLKARAKRLGLALVPEPS